jgi:hypothetical protein
VGDTKPRLSTLTYLGFSVNSAIAAGHGNAVSLSEVYENLEKGKLLEWLDQTISDAFDFGLFPAGSDQNVAINHVLNEAAAGLRGRERSKVEIETSGLHLLIAIIFEAIQRRDWV